MIQVRRVYLAVVIQIGVCTFNRLTGFFIIKLMINVEHVWLITLSQYLELIRVNAWAYKYIGCSASLNQREVLNLHFLPCKVVTQIPIPVLCFDRIGVKREFNTVAVYVTHIRKNILCEVCSCC